MQADTFRVIPYSRRPWFGRPRLLLAPLLIAAALLSVSVRADMPVVRIGSTAVYLDEHVMFVNAWQTYLEERLRRRVVFVRRGSYGEILELLERGGIDFAWICGYPYVRYKPRFRLLAVPLYQGKPLYQSYLIVPHTDVETRSLLDLRGKVFAYSDPNSNSGWLVPQQELRAQDIEPGSFFRKTFFTYAHRKVVEAVAAGLADGGAVDGYVWETLARQQPDLTRRTRVVRKSAEYGFPPFVARRSVPEEEFQRMQRVLLEMNEDSAGRDILEKLNLDGFATGSDALYAGIEASMRFVNAR